MNKISNESCAICGNASENRIHVAREMLFGYRDLFHYLECSECRCLGLMDAPDNMAKYYPATYYAHRGTAAFKALLRSRWATHHSGRKSLLGWLMSLFLGEHALAARLAQHGVPLDARILDVGCGNGVILHDLRSIGFRDLTGVDPFLGSDCRPSQGIQLLKADIEQVSDQFAVVIFNHSFEHVRHPLAVLRKAAQLLAPGGYVMIRIPVCDSYAWRKYGTDWFHLDAPRHFFLHTERSIENLVSQAEMSIVEVSPEFDYDVHWRSELYAQDVPFSKQGGQGAMILRRMLHVRQERRYRQRAIAVRNNGDSDLRFYVLRKL